MTNPQPPTYFETFAAALLSLCEGLENAVFPTLREMERQRITSLSDGQILWEAMKDMGAWLKAQVTRIRLWLAWQGLCFLHGVWFILKYLTWPLWRPAQWVFHMSAERIRQRKLARLEQVQ